MKKILFMKMNNTRNFRTNQNKSNMTQQHAYELACQEFPEFSHAKEKRRRAMEIYAASFSEWTADYWVCIEKNEKESIWSSIQHNVKIEYTTAELITEFEKQ